MAGSTNEKNIKTYTIVTGYITPEMIDLLEEEIDLYLTTGKRILPTLNSL